MPCSTRGPKQPYAHAPARDPYSEFVADDGTPRMDFAFLGAARVLKSTAKRLRWRHMTAIRTSCISRAVRLSERALGDKYVDREKRTRAWILRADVDGAAVPAVRVEWDHLRRLKEAPSPVRVVILRHGLMDEQAFLRVLTGTSAPRESST